MTATEVRAVKEALTEARTVRAIMKIEARAAKTYWSRFAVHLTARKGASLPSRWRTSRGAAVKPWPWPEARDKARQCHAELCLFNRGWAGSRQPCMVLARALR